MKGWTIACAILGAYSLMARSVDAQVLVLLLAVGVLPIPVWMNSRDLRRACLAGLIPLFVMLVLQGSGLRGPQTELLPLQMSLCLVLTNALCIPPYRLASWMMQTTYLLLLGLNLEHLHMACAAEPLLFTPLLFYGASRLARPLPAPLLEIGQQAPPSHFGFKLLGLIWGGGALMVILSGTPYYWLAFLLLTLMFLRLTRHLAVL